MKPESRRIPDTWLHYYLAGALRPKARARCEALLANSPADQARLEELRAELTAFRAHHPPELLLARFQEERDHAFSKQDLARLHELEEVKPLGKPILPPGAEALFFAPDATEVSRTPRATELLEAWFTAVERGPAGLPVVVQKRIEQLINAHGREVVGQRIFERVGPERGLALTFVPLPLQEGNQRWALLLQESYGPAVPARWRECLSARETEVGAASLQGWDLEGISTRLGISLRRVKVHLQRIFEKLDISDQSSLWALATRERGEVSELEAAAIAGLSPQIPLAWRELLTARELEVAECVLRGWDNQLIMAQLKCSLTTVKVHLRGIFDKLGVASRAQLIHLVQRSAG
jgi:DNA-binding NarL/FixJ family response regulator